MRCEVISMTYLDATGHGPSSLAFEIRLVLFALNAHAEHLHDDKGRRQIIGELLIVGGGSEILRQLADGALARIAKRIGAR
jgi:hypothetical protein